jgi:hypothetical protein
MMTFLSKKSRASLRLSGVDFRTNLAFCLDSRSLKGSRVLLVNPALDASPFGKARPQLSNLGGQGD